jgi:hypothetical protein
MPPCHGAWVVGNEAVVFIVKIEWSKKRTLCPPIRRCAGHPKSVAFIEKDSKRFPDANGWGYAQFMYNAASDTFKPYGSDSSFGKKVCHRCHTLVKARDFIFTSYPKR